MASLEDKAHDKLVSVLADSRCSPAVLAMQMIRESKYVNESMLQYLVNYIIYTADSHLVPFQLKEIQDTCKLLKLSLEELGLSGSLGRSPEVTGEYLQA